MPSIFASARRFVRVVYRYIGRIASDQIPVQQLPTLQRRSGSYVKSLALPKDCSLQSCRSMVSEDQAMYGEDCQLPAQALRCYR